MIAATAAALAKPYVARCGWCGAVERVAVEGSTPMCADCLDELYPEEDAS